MADWTHPLAGDIRCQIDGAGLWRLTRDGQELGAFTVPEHGGVLRAAGAEWRLEAFGKGWRWAATAPGREEPVGWLDGGWGVGDGRIIIAPDREYVVDLRRLSAETWRLKGDDGVLARLFVERESLRIEPCAVPTWEQDAPLALLLACVYAVGQMTTPRGDATAGAGAF